MVRTYSVLVACILLSCAGIALSQSGVRRCFQFTWLGPRYNNESVFLNATCQEATSLSAGVPCREPLVVSENGTWPDVDYIWTNYMQHATCIPAENDVCATYTYYFNGHVENSTYMCTRALDQQGQAITKGCYEQRNGSFVTKACFCQSIEGGLPCNDASITSIVSTAVFLGAVVFAMLRT